jgi:methylthioribose-1-phosphate isomerase
VVLAAARGDDVQAATAAVTIARPTAVNLGWGVRRALDAYLLVRDTDR